MTGKKQPAAAAPAPPTAAERANAELVASLGFAPGTPLRAHLWDDGQHAIRIWEAARGLGWRPVGNVREDWTMQRYGTHPVHPGLQQLILRVQWGDLGFREEDDGG